MLKYLAMNRTLERYLILFLVIVLISLSSCAKPKVNADPVSEDDIPTVSKLDGIAFVLGCMFDPAPCQEKKELAKTEEGK